VNGYAAIVLAGGAGRRMGGEGKPIRPVGGVPMVLRVLGAVIAAAPRVVVGPPELAPFLPTGVVLTRERPPGGGPAAAAAAGIAALPRAGGLIALLAADLPLLTAAAVDQLSRAATRPEVDGAVFVDTDGKPQWLCGVWRDEPLRQRMSTLGDPDGVPVRRLFAGLRVDLILPRPAGASGAGMAPWFDCDTEDDLRLAEERMR